MPSAPSPSSYGQDVSVRRRAVSIALAIAANLLLLLLLFGIAPEFHRPSGAGRRTVLSTFPMGEAERQQTAARAAPKARSAARRAVTHATPAARTPPPLVRHESELWQPPPDMLMLDKQSYAAADISHLPTHEAAADGTGDKTETAGAGEGDGAGAGPHGERLFAARWRREPTDAELSTYLPKRNPGDGWGEVACRTIEGFHVEDCEEIGESPAGSGYSRAVRQAAWQFLVWPPRVNGKTMVGTWVRIRITYTENHASAR